MSFCYTPRRAAVAGRFYPAEANALREQVRACLAPGADGSALPASGSVLAQMLPHAGYVFSGGVAGATLARAGIADRLVLLGPNHTGDGQPLSVWNGGEWLTPLGGMATDREMAAALVDAGGGFAPDAAAHLREHSLEVLVPFFQVMNPTSRMTPVTVAGVSLPALRAAGEALGAVLAAAAREGERPLLIVSSDMSHFLPHEATVQRDAIALEALVSLDAERFFHAVRDNGISMCGVYPMTIALYALAGLGAATAEVVAYATSGQTGRAFGADMERVVGYAGVIITA